MVIKVENGTRFTLRLIVSYGSGDSVVVRVEEVGPGEIVNDANVIEPGTLNQRRFELGY